MPSGLKINSFAPLDLQYLISNNMKFKSSQKDTCQTIENKRIMFTAKAADLRFLKK